MPLDAVTKHVEVRASQWDETLAPAPAPVQQNRPSSSHRSSSSHSSSSRTQGGSSKKSLALVKDKTTGKMDLLRKATAGATVAASGREVAPSHRSSSHREEQPRSSSHREHEKSQSQREVIRRPSSATPQSQSLRPVSRPSSSIRPPCQHNTPSPHTRLAQLEAAAGSGSARPGAGAHTRLERIEEKLRDANQRLAEAKRDKGREVVVVNQQQAVAAQPRAQYRVCPYCGAKLDHTGPCPNPPPGFEATHHRQRFDGTDFRG